MRVRSFTLSAVLVALLSMTVWAADSNKATIRLSEPTIVGSAQLAPGEYKLTWTGTGSDVQATFSQGKKTVATVPAHLVQEASGYSSPVIRTNSETKALLGVGLPKVSLSFTGDGAASSGN